MRRSPDSSFQGLAGVAREALRLVSLIALCGLGLYFLDFGCLFKAVTGLSCPGCGMTRAWLSAFALDFDAALAYHPLFGVVPPALVLASIQGQARRDGPWENRGMRSRLCDAVIVALIVFLLALWVVRILDPADAGLLFGGVPPEGLPTDVVGWNCPAWVALLSGLLA